MVLVISIFTQVAGLSAETKSTASATTVETVAAPDAIATGIMHNRYTRSAFTRLHSARTARRVSGVAFSGDGKLLAVSGGAQLGLFQVATGKQILAANFSNKIRDAQGTETAEDLSAVPSVRTMS